jgi:formiminotetrahydrofolate cyclodeaminase
MKEFVSELASSSPAPGGGTISAVNGAFAAGLGVMVCGLTLQRSNKTEASDLLLEVMDSLAIAQKRFIELADEDTDAFNKVMRAYKLPKTSEHEQETRKKEIEAAMVEATQIPMETTQLSITCCKLLESVASVAHDNVLSDCGVAIECAHLAALGAIMNVTINLPSITDTNTALKFQSQLDAAKTEIQIQHGKTDAVFKNRFVY